MEKLVSWRVAVIGAGPAGFYAAEALLRQTDIPVTVDIFDALPAPYGLVRYGVAPDHPKIKAVIRLYDKTARRSGVRFWGNICIGRDISLKALLTCYHQVLFSTGAQKDRRLGIKGEDLAGVSSATEFVGWYNGHPDFSQCTFNQAQSVGIVGNGNVALDVARILVRKTGELAKTDIAERALCWLRKSKLREVHVLGRRGPVQAAFSTPELREMMMLDEVDVIVSKQDLMLDEASRTQMEGAQDPTARRNYTLLCEHAKKPLKQAGRKVYFHFWKLPAQLTGSTSVEQIRFECGRPAPDPSGWVGVEGLGVYESLPVQQVFRSIGYFGAPVADVPFDEKRGVIPNQEGRVLDAHGQVVLRVYVAGWIKRGPKGVIGTNKQDAQQTVTVMLQALLEQKNQGVTPLSEKKLKIETIFERQKLRPVSYAEWSKLDSIERQRGEQVGKPREKFLHIQGMIAALEN